MLFHVEGNLESLVLYQSTISQVHYFFNILNRVDPDINCFSLRLVLAQALITSLVFWDGLWVAAGHAQLIIPIFLSAN